MREIKFRYVLQNTQTSEISFDFLPLERIQRGIQDRISWEYIIDICQYTGLQDKNGLEIFGGDLYEIRSDLKINIWNWIESIDTYFLCKIVFDLWGFCWEIIKCNWIKKEEWFYKNDYQDWKNTNLWKKLWLPIYQIDKYVFKNDIIWNIYQNPDLLNNK